MKTTKPSRRPERTPLSHGIAFLSRREYSRCELERKLTLAGYERDAILTALDRLTAENWQSDLRFAQALVRMRASSGYGPLRIRNELQTHRIREDEVIEAMKQFDGKWDDIAAEWVDRRYGRMLSELTGSPSEEGQSREAFMARRDAQMAVQRKAADFLTRRGFDYTCMRSAVAALASS